MPRYQFLYLDGDACPGNCTVVLDFPNDDAAMKQARDKSVDQNILLVKLSEPEGPVEYLVGIINNRRYDPMGYDSARPI